MSSHPSSISLSPSPTPTPSQSQSQSQSPSVIKPPSSRRVPPPCWTHEETLALIESYHEKWYSLRRGNLKASHWQEVADSVARRCRFAIPSKTSVQCRHKIEKLRKRYRTEKQRAINAPNRFSSSWNFFKKMDDMEKGPLLSTTITTTTPIIDEDSEDDQDSEEDQDQDDVDEDDSHTHPHHHPPHGIVNNVHYISTSATNAHRLIAAAANGGSQSPVGVASAGSGGFRFRIPSGSRTVPSPLGSVKKPMNYARFDQIPNSVKPNVVHNPNLSPNPRFLNSSSVGGGGGSLSRSSVGYGNKSDGIGGGGGGVGSGSGKVASGGSKRGMDPIADMVSSIRMLGEKFVKMEEMKIGMAREMEQMRMDMEMKRTEMILDSQQRIVEAFAQGISGKKKMKRMPSPEES
ncbi:hypothetical protein AQUCO_05300088v1 [Aquilegia coerulea]|uniref:Myb-like domain-containing protein n=1 Tax=Aquilegia coerulea TaxID=218851 RepID=A0A2G5CIB3_AQUCA|nr:hypothetical protein AQUCO_05300088v1 [Aquilegia coerulea]